MPDLTAEQDAVASVGLPLLRTLRRLRSNDAVDVDSARERLEARREVQDCISVEERLGDLCADLAALLEGCGIAVPPDVRTSAEISREHWRGVGRAA